MALLLGACYAFAPLPFGPVEPERPDPRMALSVCLKGNCDADELPPFLGRINIPTSGGYTCGCSLIADRSAASFTRSVVTCHDVSG